MRRQPYWRQVRLLLKEVYCSTALEAASAAQPGRKQAVAETALTGRLTALIYWGEYFTRAPALQRDTHGTGISASTVQSIVDARLLRNQHETHATCMEMPIHDPTAVRSASRVLPRQTLDGDSAGCARGAETPCIGAKGVQTIYKVAFSHELTTANARQEQAGHGASGWLLLLPYNSAQRTDQPAAMQCSAQ